MGCAVLLRSSLFSMQSSVPSVIQVLERQLPQRTQRTARYCITLAFDFLLRPSVSSVVQLRGTAIAAKGADRSGQRLPHRKEPHARPQRHVDRPMNAGTSMSGPTTAAGASPEPKPKVDRYRNGERGTDARYTRSISKPAAIATKIHTAATRCPSPRWAMVRRHVAKHGLERRPIGGNVGEECVAHRGLQRSNSSLITVADAGHAPRNSFVARTSSGTASRVVVRKPKLGKYASAVVVSR